MKNYSSLQFSLKVLIVVLLTGQSACIGETGAETNGLNGPSQSESASVGEFYDGFQNGALSKRTWKVTRKNDFRESIIDIFEVSEGDYRLRLSADTVGTRDDDIKYHGIRTLMKIDFARGKIISFELDWNNQENGSYLTAGLYLSPVATAATPRDESVWLAFEYVGVPPGKNIRFQIAEKKNGNVRYLFTEGWPEKGRAGRKIDGIQHIELWIEQKRLRVKENGEELISVENHDLGFDKAFLYPQMSSHSNYSRREIFFDNIRVTSMN